MWDMPPIPVTDNPVSQDLAQEPDEGADIGSLRLFSFGPTNRYVSISMYLEPANSGRSSGNAASRNPTFK